MISKQVLEDLEILIESWAGFSGTTEESDYARGFHDALAYASKRLAQVIDGGEA